MTTERIEAKETIEMLERAKRSLVDVSYLMRMGLGLKPGDRPYDHVQMAVAGVLAMLGTAYQQYNFFTPENENDSGELPF